MLGERKRDEMTKDEYLRSWQSSYKMRLRGVSMASREIHTTETVSNTDFADKDIFFIKLIFFH